MDEFKLKRLLPRKSTTCIDEFEFTRRIHAEHLFVSVDEAFEYLDAVIDNKSLNPDDPFFISYNKSPILAINIIDESVCSIIYEVYQMWFKHDRDSIGYITFKIYNIRSKIMNLGIKMMKKYPYLETLYILMDHIFTVSNPATFGEEYDFGKLSRTYYQLMYTLYRDAKPRDDYFRKYRDYYDKKRKWNPYHKGEE